MTDFQNNIEDFYKVLTPADLYGRTRQIENAKSVSLDSLVYENYLVGVYSGDEIIASLSGKTGLEGLGVYFNTVFQDANSEKSKYLEPQYWVSRSGDDIVNSKRFPKNPPDNFYASVCKKASKSPPVDFSVNVLRSTYATRGTGTGGAVLPYGIRNCDAIELFLNYMPSIFPSMMVPYFEVEFDFPVRLRDQDPSANRETDKNYLNRPSLLRFLLGSAKIGGSGGVELNLTEADKSLIVVKQVKTRSGKVEPVYNVGMELFTSPQTLTNMDGLQAEVNSSRVKDVKPFLPPATLTGGTVNLMNAGNGVINSTKASVQMTIHDKARVAEFAEFFRIAHGTQDLTVWLTYGWLSPRGDTQDDAYARFINQTMIVKAAFNIGNASFSFDNVGQASVSLELVSQGTLFVDTYQLDSGDAEESIYTDLSDISRQLKTVEEGRDTVNDLEKEIASIQIYKDYKSTIEGVGPKSLTDDEIKKIKSLKNDISKSKAINDATRTSLTNALDAALKIDEYYNKKQNKLRVDARSYATKKFEECRELNSLDPFIPEDFKHELLVNNKPYTVFKEDLINQIEVFNSRAKSVQAKSGGGKAPKVAVGNRRIVSLGKVFCCFCLPPILDMAKTQGIEEVQTIFYQLNESCGPISLHSVAEFPLDIVKLSEEFAIEAEKRGNDSMTVSRFLNFVVNASVNDDRAIGYGKTALYEDYTVEKPDIKPKGPSQGFSFDEKQKQWIDKYGSLVHPRIYVKIEVLKKRTTSSNIDLLEEIRNPDATNLPKIMKIHVFDARANPYSNIKKRILKNSVGAYVGVPEEQIDSELLEVEYDKQTQTLTMGDVSVTAKTRNPLPDFLGNSLPTITVGSNGSLVSSIGFSSKLDSTLGTAMMVTTQKGFRGKNTLAPNGLMMKDTDLPVRTTDASVSMNSIGCPIADLYQHFYIDFGTGTTLDNIYAASGISHSFSPGKFETTWTFLPTDGYGKFSGAEAVNIAVEKALKAREELREKNNKK